MMRTLLTLMTATGLYAQSSVRGPVLGWVYEPSSQSVRAVLGIPGSSLLGDRLSATGASLAGNRAITFVGDRRQSFLLDLTDASTRKLDVPDGAAQAVFSASGSAAALVYRDALKLVLLKGLPENPSVGFEASLAADGLPLSLAVADDGAGLLAAYDSAVTAFDGDGNRWKLNFESTARTVAFLDGSHDALIAAADGVWLVRDTAGNANAKKIWSGNAQNAAISADRRQVVLIDGDGMLISLNPETGMAKNIDCSCGATTLARMSQAVFRVNELSDGPLWLVDLNGVEARAVFVPPDVKPADQ